MNVPIHPVLRSKKFVTAALASAFASYMISRGVPLEEVKWAVSPLLLSIGMQGVADFGKERAKVEAGARSDG